MFGQHHPEDKHAYAKSFCLFLLAEHLFFQNGTKLLCPSILQKEKPLNAPLLFLGSLEQL